MENVKKTTQLNENNQSEQYWILVIGVVFALAAGYILNHLQGNLFYLVLDLLFCIGSTLAIGKYYKKKRK